MPPEVLRHHWREASDLTGHRAKRTRIAECALNQPVQLSFSSWRGMLIALPNAPGRQRCLQLG